MLKTKLLKIVYATLLLGISFTSNCLAEFKVVGYLYNWGNFINDANNVDYTKVTHINIAFINPDVNGDLGPTTDLSSVVNIVHNGNCKILASLGGANANNNGYWTAVMQNATTRTSFIAKAAKFVRDYNLDGIDLDIEGDILNGTAVTSSQYEKFVLQLGDSLKAQNKIFSAALASWFIGYVTTTASKKFDWINVMSYDAYGTWTGPGQHSSFNMMVTDYGYWLNKVSDKSKLVLGLASYGYKWTGNSSNGSSSQPFKNIITQYPRGLNQDSIRPASGQVIYYNGITTIKNKTNYAISNAGGVMMWTLQYDFPTSNSNSLILAISQVRATAIEKLEEPSISTEISPNPFTEQTTLKFNIEKPTPAQVQILDTQGMIVNTLADDSLDAGNYALETNLNGLASGLYFLTIKTNYNTKTIRLIKL